MTNNWEETIEEMWKTNRGSSEDIFTLNEFLEVIRQEKELSRKEERERIIKILDMSIFNDPDYYHGSEKLSCVKDLIQNINQEDK